MPKRQIHVASYGQLWLCHNIDSLVAKAGARSCWHVQGMLFHDCHDLSDLFHPAQKPEVTYRLSWEFTPPLAKHQSEVLGDKSLGIVQAPWATRARSVEGDEEEKRSLNEPTGGKKADHSTFFHQSQGALDRPVSRLSRLISASQPLQPGVAGGPCR